MSKVLPSCNGYQEDWKDLVERAVLNPDPPDSHQSLQDAQDALMQKIEELFQTASPPQLQQLVNAMNAVRELNRAFMQPLAGTQADSPFQAVV